MGEGRRVRRPFENLFTTRSPVRMRCDGGLIRGRGLEGGKEGENLRHPQESKLVLNWMQAMTKSQNRGRPTDFWPSWN